MVEWFRQRPEKSHYVGSNPIRSTKQVFALPSPKNYPCSLVMGRDGFYGTGGQKDWKTAGTETTKKLPLSDKDSA